MGLILTPTSAAYATSGRSAPLDDVRESVDSMLQRHRRIALDASPLIYLLDGDGPRADIAAAIVDAIADGVIQGAIASVGLSEVLVGWAIRGDGPAFERVADSIRGLGLDIVDLDPGIAEDAAWIRGRTGIGLADAIHLASAIDAEATAFITNDRRIPALRDLEIVQIDDLVA
jgi:predicted nucleic acid-binding protein